MGSSFSDFLGQIPLGPIIMFCGSGILMVIALVAIVQARSRRARDAANTQAQAYVPYELDSTDSSSDMGDLPDLDMLVKSSPQSATPTPAPSAPTRAARKGTYSVKLADGDSTEAVEVMAILRDVVDGSLMVQMGDKVFRTLAGDETQKNNFMKVMRELSTVVKTAPQVSSQPEQVTESEQPDEVDEPAALRDLIDTSVAQESIPTKPAPRPTPPVLTGVPLPGDLPKFKMEPLPAKKPGGILRRGKLELEPVPELNIAGAIEAFLQHKLQFTPEYAGRSIHVHPAPGGGVAIEVDGRFFEAVGDVDDEEIRTFLQTTIQEWQQRN